MDLRDFPEKTIQEYKLRDIARDRKVYMEAR
jgi:hypothetical protein